MTRILDTATLDGAARHLAAEFLRPDVPHTHVDGKFIGGRSYVMQDFFNFTYKDEFDYLQKAFRGQLGAKSLTEFDALAEKKFAPRSDAVLAENLATKLAVTPDGKHIPGRVGTVQVGNRVVGKRVKVVLDGLGNSTPIFKNVYWPIYAGETEERVKMVGPDGESVSNSAVDDLPEGTEPLPVGALNTRISNEVAQLMANAGVDNLDEGAGAAVIQGRSGAQPADPDTAVTGTLLFTLVCSDPAFTAATDAAPGALKTASAITDDTSADATATLGYCRASSTADGATPADDHIDGEAGTSGADFNFNTVAIVAGATVSMTSWLVTMPEA